MFASLQDRLQAALGSDFTLERELGGGGMSRVFVAEERGLHRKAVVKVLPDELAETVNVQRFQREIQLLGNLQHPNIVPILRAGDSLETPFYIMSFVEGESLRAVLARQGRLPLGDVLRLTRDIASALAYAHAHHVVHRDIKPENVMLTSGAAVVTDFGIAKALGAATADGGVRSSSPTITSLGVSIGTPAYMSPEQVVGAPDLDARSDIYSLGCVAYEMLAGHPPFRASQAARIAAQHVAEPPHNITLERSDTPPGLATLVMTCLSKDPNERPQTAAEVVRRIDAMFAPRASVTSRFARSASIAAVIALSALLVAGVMWSRRTSSSAGATRFSSIAVLPLTVVGGDSASQWMADGATDELTTALGGLSGVRVLPPTSAAAAVAKVGRDPRSVSRLLGVAAVLEGSLRRTPQELRLSMRLLDASDGSLIWSQEFSRALLSATDIFNVQNEVALKIANALRVRLEPSAHPMTANVSLAAHDLYLRGRYFAARYTEDDLRRAIALYDSATTLEPTYALPFAAKAEAWSYIADTWVAPREAYPKSNAAVRQALKLDSTLADAWAVRGNIAAIYYWNPSVASESARRALAEDSTSSAAILAVGSELMTSNLDSARVLLKLGERSDPLNPLFPFWAAATSLAMGQTAEGCADAKRGAELAPGTAQEWMLAECFLARREYDSAAAHLREPAKGSPQIRALYARALALGSHRAESRAELAQLEKERNRRYVSGVPMAATYAILGDTAAAFRALERAVEDRAAELAILPLQSVLAPLRSFPRYTAIMARMKPLDPDKD